MEFVDSSYYGIDEPYHIGTDNEFMMAVSVERHKKGARMDPRYVQWVATLITSTPDSFTEIYVPMKPCTEA